MKKKRFDLKIFVICLAIVFMVAILGSLVTSISVDSQWFDTIKPKLTPPNWVFPIVWNVLYLLIAISLYLSWKNASKKYKKEIIVVFGINLLLNFLWTVLYFGIRNTLLALVDILLLILSIISMIVVTSKVNKDAAYLLIPYLLWVIFASFLNYLSVRNQFGF